MKRVLLTLVALLLLMSVACSLAGCEGDYKVDGEETPDEDSLYLRTGDQITFGSYPQTQVTDTALESTLSALAARLPTSSDACAWTSYGYYVSGSVRNYMWYIDVEEGGERYRGVYFTSYRPEYGFNSGTAENSTQDENGYCTGTVYWFQYEPITWTVLSEKNGTALLLCNMIIDSQAYDYEGGSKDDRSYSNDYADSTIRAWLNEVFYETAFSDLQRDMILTATVNNSAASTDFDPNEYACEDTEDKIFLLSYQEATNAAYGLDSNTDRQKSATDYAECQGVYTDTDGSYVGNGYWWLRSPSAYGPSAALRINSRGMSSYSALVYASSPGVVPALWIKL